MPKPWALHLGFGVEYGNFTEVLEPIIEVATLELDAKHVHSFDVDCLVKKRSKMLFDCE
jgi:hypothetical protein